MRISVKKISPESIFLYIILLVVILNNNSIWSVINSTQILILELFALSACMFGMIINLMNKSSIAMDTANFFFIMGFFFLALIYCALKMQGHYKAIIVLLIIMPMMFIFQEYLLKENLLEKLFVVLYYVILTIVVISLFFWIFGSILKWISATGLVEYTWGIKVKVKEYYHLYVEAQGSDLAVLGINLEKRNCAFFVEASMANYIFCIGLILAEFYIKSNKKQKAILIIGILSTLSITGVSFLILYAIYKIFSIQGRGRWMTAIKIILTVFGTAFFVYMIYRMLGMKLDTKSGMVRSEKIHSEFEVFKNNILIGNGFLTYTNGSSNGFTALLADGGLYLWGIYWIPLIGCFLCKIYEKKLDYAKLLYMFLLMVTVIQYSTFNAFVCMLAWHELIEYFSKPNRKKE